MAKIASFRGWRFNQSKVGDLNKVVTQPYDKIDGKLQQDYLSRSEWNIVRIIKGPTRPDDNPNDNQYTRAANYWQEWIEDGVLTREPGPAIYPYFQEFTVDGNTFVRKGLIALVSLDDEKLSVRAHEHTLKGPKADRLKLMRATEANDGQIFMLYDDAQMKVNQFLEQALIGAKPVMEVRDDYSAIHRLYRISSPSVIRDIADAMEDMELFIADGHHRYETAVTYMQQCKSRLWKPVGAETFTHRMMTMVNMRDPGLVILPTHRVIHSVSGFSAAAFLAKLPPEFQVKELADRASLYVEMDAAFTAGKNAVGFAAEGLNGFRLLTLNDPSLMNRLVTEPHCDAWKKLDVTVLHTALLERHLGIDKEKLAAESNLHYIRGRDEALDMVGRDGCQAAFLLNPTRIDQVSEVAGAGERMPQKSTDFFPKLLTGMVMMRMSIDKSMGLAVWEAEE